MYMRPIDRFIVHCSYTPPSMDVGVAEFRQWHVIERNWSDVGYHFVIRRDGTVEHGRPIEIAGAHVKGMNANSIAICLVGGKTEARSWMYLKMARKSDFNFTWQQMRALQEMRFGVGSIGAQFPEAVWEGHRKHNMAKACPCFDVEAWGGVAA